MVFVSFTKVFVVFTMVNASSTMVFAVATKVFVSFTIVFVSSTMASGVQSSGYVATARGTRHLIIATFMASFTTRQETMA
jgi:hypothetical protein